MMGVDVPDEELDNEDDVLSSDSEEDEEALDEKVAELENSIQLNPFDYDSHCEIIQVYRRQGELDKLRMARSRMHTYYPLTPEMWLRWLQDEEKLIDVDEDKNKVRALFETALKDYIHVDIWLEYCTFMIGNSDFFGLEEVRSVFDQALSWCGCHFTKGYLIWETCREFEMILLMKSQSDNSENSSQQEQRIKSLYTRQLKIPLQNMETTLEEYKEYNGGVVEENIVNEYKKNLDKVRELQTFETLLETSEDEDEKNTEVLLRTYMAYLDYMLKDSSKDVGKIFSLFERAICDCCLQADLWFKYAEFLELKFPFADKILPFYLRSVRNTPWSARLWLQYALAAEKFKEPHEKINSVYEQALISGITNANDVLQLILYHLSYLRRAFHNTEDDEFKSTLAEEIRQKCSNGFDQIQDCFGKEGDSQCQIYQFWALFEAKYMKNLEKARNLWAEIMKHDHGNKASMWLNNIHFELRFGDSKHIDRAFSRALNSVTDDPDKVFAFYHSYLLEEMDSLASFLESKKKIDLQKKRLSERAATATSELTNENLSKNDKKTGGKGKKRELELSTKKSLPTKRAKFSEPVVSIEKGKKDEEGFAIPTMLPAGSKISKTNNTLKDTRKETTNVTNNTSASSAPAHGETVPHNPEKDDRTVFLSNLDFEIKEDDIRDFMKECGEVTDVRLVRNFRGVSKGFGYVEFQDSSAAQQALRLDRVPLKSLEKQKSHSQGEGRPVFISSCNPEERHSFQYGTGIEKHKLFIRNIAPTVTRQMLMDIFQEFGTVKEIRIPTLRNGKPKNCAYVEFRNANEASRALVKTDNMELEGRVITVHISNPPPRGQTLQTFVSHRGGGADLVPPVHDHARKRIDLMLPRNVAKKEISPSEMVKSSVAKESGGNGSKMEVATETSANVQQSRKTNEEFRKMFMK